MPNKVIEFNWEMLDIFNYRTKVFGGWLVRTENLVAHLDQWGNRHTGEDCRISMCFVPDPNHDWVVEES